MLRPKAYRLGLLGILLTLCTPWGSACSSDPARSLLTLRLASSGQSCETPAKTSLLSALSSGTLRLTLVRHTETTPQGELLCDQSADLAIAGTTMDLAIDANAEERIDLIAEVFSSGPPVKLVARGHLLDLNARPRVGKLEVLLTPVGHFACTPTPLRSRRGFHTATALPNGQVLILGGLTDKAPPGATGPGLWIEPRMELYDPSTGHFIEVVSDAPLGRAFHRATLLRGPAEGPYDVLLLGGVMAKEGTLAPAARHGIAGAPLPFMPVDGSVPAPATIVRIFPFADPPQAEVQPAPPVLARRVFGSLTQLDGGAVLSVGGLEDYAGGHLVPSNTVEVLPGGTSEHHGPFPLTRMRVAAATASISPTKVLVVGGNFDSTATRQSAEAVEVVDIASGVSSHLATFEAGSSSSKITAVARATLTALDSDGEVLLVGGLSIDQGQAKLPRRDASVLRLTSVSGGALRVSPVGSALFVPVAYHTATPLPNSDVLITGGLAAPQTCPSGEACNKAYLYHRQDDQLVGTKPLVEGRLGHVATLLTDGAVLITGGLGFKATVASALGGAEIYTPTITQDAFGRAPGEESRQVCAH